jgi:hypothetical protein
MPIASVTTADVANNGDRRSARIAYRRSLITIDILSRENRLQLYTRLVGEQREHLGSDPHPGV